MITECKNIFPQGFLLSVKEWPQAIRYPSTGSRGLVYGYLNKRQWRRSRWKSCACYRKWSKQALYKAYETKILNSRILIRKNPKSTRGCLNTSSYSPSPPQVQIKNSQINSGNIESRSRVGGSTAIHQLDRHFLVHSARNLFVSPSCRYTPWWLVERLPYRGSVSLAVGLVLEFKVQFSSVLGESRH